MKIIKRNQIIILVIALMLVSAGYLNYTSNLKNNIIATSVQENSIEYAGIGDAKLVSSNGIIENIDDTAMVTNNLTNENIITKENTETISTETSSKIDKEAQEYFSSSRLNREKMYSQMIESYQKILENESIGEEQKAIAQTEIQNINQIKNRIMICENLIKTKGIEDLVIFVNDKSISAVIRTEKLEQDQIAQIQNIIAREMQTEITNIHISNK